MERNASSNDLPEEKGRDDGKRGRALRSFSQFSYLSCTGRRKVIGGKEYGKDVSSTHPMPSVPYKKKKTSSQRKNRRIGRPKSDALQKEKKVISASHSNWEYEVSLNYVPITQDV